MIICKLSISFERGVAHNRAEDLGLDGAPETTQDGLALRGLGTHWKSDEDRVLARDRSNEDRRLRVEFSRQFAASLIPGCFVLSRNGEGREFLAGLDVRPDVFANAMEFDLTPTETLPPKEIADWGDRIKAQISKAPLGRGKTASVEGLDVLKRLAKCPVLDRATREDLRSLIIAAKLEKVDRVELRRKLQQVKVAVDPKTVSTPRRAPVVRLQDPDDQPKVRRPRRA